jgi:hypothetical protein
MLNISHVNWYVAIAVAIVVISAACVITRVRGRQKFRSNGRRAIERLSKLERGAPPGPEPALRSALAPQIEPQVQAILEREELSEHEPAVNLRLPLQVGTKVQAVRNFGPVKNGALGIITGAAELRVFWRSRPTYLCTFADNIKCHARPKQIEAYEHGYILEELERPDFAAILSRQMLLRAQQFGNGHERHVGTISSFLPKAGTLGRG